MESLLLHKLRDPFGCLVLLDELLLDLSNFNEPAIESTIDQWSLTSPAERVAMLHCSSTQETTLVLQVLLDLLVSFLDVDALIVGHLREELAILIDRNWGFASLDQALLDARRIIILTEARSHVDDASTGISRNVVAMDNMEAAVSSAVFEVLEQASVLGANDGLAFELFKHLVFLDDGLLENVGQTLLHANVFLARSLVQECHVKLRLMYCKRKVAWQRPRCGRPRDKVDVF